MNRRIIPLIMCGGAGTRLWPASREVHPKQFLPLFGARSTFQDTLLRVSDAALFERPVVITNNGCGVFPTNSSFPVNLGYHWYDSAGRSVVWDGTLPQGTRAYGGVYVAHVFATSDVGTALDAPVVVNVSWLISVMVKG